jgi:hypothetical protein
MVKNHSLLEVLLIIQHSTDLDKSKHTLTRSDFIGKSSLPRARDEIYNGSEYDKNGTFGGSGVNTQDNTVRRV